MRLSRAFAFVPPAPACLCFTNQPTSTRSDEPSTREALHAFHLSECLHLSSAIAKAENEVSPLEEEPTFSWAERRNTERGGSPGTAGTELHRQRRKGNPRSNAIRRKRLRYQASRTWRRPIHRVSIIIVFPRLVRLTTALANSIVAVHGLDGDREKSWTADNGVLWLQALLPKEIPAARVLTYGYDSRTRSSEHLTRQTLYGHSESLISALSLYRRKTKASAPVITVVRLLLIVG